MNPELDDKIALISCWIMEACKGNIFDTLRTDETAMICAKALMPKEQHHIIRSAKWTDDDHIQVYVVPDQPAEYINITITVK
jgi:hypothetical protein